MNQGTRFLSLSVMSGDMMMWVRMQAAAERHKPFLSLAEDAILPCVFPLRGDVPSAVSKMA
jgi:hypothetical protein